MFHFFCLVLFIFHLIFLYHFLSSSSFFVSPVNLMPGASDPANITLPQQVRYTYPSILLPFFPPFIHSSLPPCLLFFTSFPPLSFLTSSLSLHSCLATMIIPLSLTLNFLHLHLHPSYPPSFFLPFFSPSFPAILPDQN